MAKKDDPATLRFVSDKEEAEHYEKVARALRTVNADHSRRSFVKSLGLVAAAPIAASGWFQWYKDPRTVERFKFIPVNNRGEIIRTLAENELPPEAKNDYIAVSECWDYLIARESYSEILMSQNWDMVSAMSDDAVRVEYQRKQHYKNPKSNYQQYKKNGYILIERDSHDDLPPPEGYSGRPVGYQLRFRRVSKHPENTVIMSSMWKAQIRFKRGVSGIPENQLYEFNGLGIQVTFYSSTQISEEIPY